MSTIQDRPVSQRWIQHRTGQSVKDGYNTQPAGQSKMDTTQDRPVSQRWIQHKTGQSVKDGYNTQLAGQSTMRFIFNTGLASQFRMDTIQSGQSVKDGTTQDQPVSQRWIQHTTGQSVKDGYNTQPASQSKMDTTQDRPVSQRWIQYTTGRSVYNEIHIQYRAGQSVQDGYNTVWPVGQRWYNKLTSQSVQDGYNPVWPVGQRWVQQIDQPVGLGPVTGRFGWQV